jgi:oligopeptide/dipeptide ABC transporter ATP-binding protein
VPTVAEREPSVPLLQVEGLTEHYQGKAGLIGRLMGRKPPVVRAVSDVSFAIRRGETLGVIGESGCGKTTLGRAILRLHEPTSGRIILDGTDLSGLDQAGLRTVRRRMQIIFQDPYASLNPRKTVEEIIGLPLRIHEPASTEAIRRRVAELIERVGLKASQLRRYPHQFSGGQRQRIGIARALILKPDFVVCDEPVSALDVSIQAQIIQLLRELKDELGLTYMFISHDLSVVGYVSNRIAVMYLGEIVELADTRSLLKHPAHPYTQALLSAVPQVDHVGRHERIRLKGDLPSPMSPPSGCKFHTRCPYAMEICRRVAPKPIRLGPDHVAACHLHDKTVPCEPKSPTH